MIRKLLFVLPLASCSSSADFISFNEEVLPILNRHCVLCHLPGAEQAELSLYPDAWSQLVGIPSRQSALSLVEPGSPGKSYLYLKLIGTQETEGGTGLQMPFQQNPLDSAQIEAIRLCIEQGAKQN